MMERKVSNKVFSLTLIALFFLGSTVFSASAEERTSFKEELSYTHEQSYFAKKGWQNGLSELTQSRQRLPWRMGTWEERVNYFISRLRKGDKKAFLYVGYGLLDGYGNPYTHKSVRGYPVSKGSSESKGVVWKLHSDAKQNNTTIEKVLTKGKADLRKKVVKAVAKGLFNKDPRVRLIAINLLRRLRPDASIASDVKRAMLVETVTTERAKWRETDLDIPSIENPRLGWRSVASSGGGTFYSISDRYKDGSSGGMEDLLNGNGKGIYLSEGLYKKNERNDFVSTFVSTNHVTGRQEARQVWTKAALLRYGADDQVSGFETHYRFKEVELMPKHVYLYVDYRNPGSELVGETAYYAYHSVWEEMKKLELFVSRAVWVDKVKKDKNALRIINKDAFRALADQIDGESIHNVPMKSPGFKIFGEKEVSKIIVGMLENRVVSTREESVRFLKRLFDRPETSVATRKVVKKALREARKREIIIDTIRGRHLHASLVVPKQPDDWWGEADEIDTSTWGRNRGKKQQIYRNQVEFPEETDIIYHDRRKPGQEEGQAKEASNKEANKEAKEVKQEDSSATPVTTKEEASVDESDKALQEQEQEAKASSEEPSKGTSEAVDADKASEVSKEGEVAEEATVAEEEPEKELARPKSYAHPLFAHVKDGRLSFDVIDEYLNLDKFLSGKNAASTSYNSSDKAVLPGQSPGLTGDAGSIKSSKRSVTAQYYEKVRAVETLHSLLLANSDDILKASYVDLQNAFLILLKIQKEHNSESRYDFLSYFLAGAFSASGQGRRFHNHENLSLELGRGSRARNNLRSLVEGIRSNVNQFGLKRGNIPTDEAKLDNLRKGNNSQDISRQGPGLSDGVGGRSGGKFSGHGAGGYYGFYDQQRTLTQAENDKAKLQRGFYQFPPQWRLNRAKIVKGLLETLVAQDPQKRLLVVHLLRRLIPQSSMLPKVNKLLRELETVDKRPYLFFDTFLDYSDSKDVKVRVQEKIVGHELLKLQRFIVRRILVNKIRSGNEPDFLKEIPKGSFLTLVVRIDAEWDPYRVPLRTPIPRNDAGRNGMFFTKSDIDVIRGGLENRNFLVQREVARWIVLFYEYNRTVTKHIGGPAADGSARKFMQSLKKAERMDIVYYERNYVQWKYKSESFSKTAYVGDPDNKVVKKQGVAGIPVGRVAITIGSVSDTDIFSRIDQDRRKEFIDRYGRSLDSGADYESFVAESVPSDKIDSIRGDIRRSYRSLRDKRDKEKIRLGDTVRDDNDGLDYVGN